MSTFPSRSLAGSVNQDIGLRDPIGLSLDQINRNQPANVEYGAVILNFRRLDTLTKSISEAGYDNLTFQASAAVHLSGRTNLPFVDSDDTEFTQASPDRIVRRDFSVGAPFPRK